MLDDHGFGYAAEKLAAARRGLMAPHPRGEAESYALAFHECMLGLRDLDRSKLSDQARSWVSTIERIMAETGIKDLDKRGTWTIRAEQMTLDERFDFSKAVDELVYWLEGELEQARYGFVKQR